MSQCFATRFNSTFTCPKAHARKDSAVSGDPFVVIHDPDKLDGLNASTVIVDEYSQADSVELKNVLTSSMDARVNPLTIIITTVSDKLESPFVEMLESYKSVLRGEIENDNIFAHLFEPDVGDREDHPHTWHKVQPHIGITVQDSGSGVVPIGDRSR